MTWLQIAELEIPGAAEVQQVPALGIPLFRSGYILGYKAALNFVREEAERVSAECMRHRGHVIIELPPGPLTLPLIYLSYVLDWFMRTCIFCEKP